ncbi:MAG: hypothetical protein IJU79_05960 [Desulfovibrionaceae bacterium]|nr:hypothetical protein [Desulfovibrionaceae bacterium]
MPQVELLNLQGRSAIIDLICSLGDERKVIVEIQKRHVKDHIRTARYNTALVTVDTTDPGEDTSNITDVILIYVTKGDLFGYGKTKYVVKRTIANIGKAIDDGEVMIFINAKVNDGSRISHLMQIFLGDKQFLNEFPKIHNRIKQLLETEKGIEEMSTLYEQYFSDEWNENQAQWKKKEDEWKSEKAEWEKKDAMRNKTEEELRKQVDALKKDNEELKRCLQDAKK